MRHLSSYFPGRVPRVVAVALVTPALLLACAGPTAGQPPTNPMAVHLATVEKGTIAGAVVYTGNAASQAKVTLLPKVAGQITVLNVDVGSAVKKGDVIAELDHAVQDAQIAQAVAGVDVAKSRLATIQAGSRPEMIAQARANLEASQAALTFLQRGGRLENVRAAQGSVESALGRLNSLQAGRPESVAQAQANVNAATAKLATLRNGSRPEVIAQAKSNLDAAQARLQALKNGPTLPQIQVAQQQVEAAKDASFGANVSKDGACNPSNPQFMCNAAQAQAAAAATAANAAQAQLKVLTSPPTPEQLQQAQAAVDVAEKQYELAQNPYAAPDFAQAQAAIDAARAQVALAQHPASSGDITAAAGTLNSARAQLDLARSPYSAADLAKAQAAVDVADQQLKLATTPYTIQDEAAAKAAVAQAQAALDTANVARDQAIVRAPIDAVVAQKLLVVGSLAAPTAPIAVLIAPRVEVIVEAEAPQVNAMKTGESATITSDALPGKAIAGTISSIAPIIDARTRTVEVKVTPTADDSGLRDGMLAQVTFVSATHEGVVTVPAEAVVQRNSQATVYVVADNVAKPVIVQTGLTDGKSTEIVSGVQVGQAVVVSGQDRLTGAQPIVVQN